MHSQTKYADGSPSGDYRTPATYEGEVVQVGSGWNGVDAADAYLWVRLPERTEHKLAIEHCALLTPAERQPDGLIHAARPRRPAGLSAESCPTAPTAPTAGQGRHG